MVIKKEEEERKKKLNCNDFIHYSLIFVAMNLKILSSSSSSLAG